MPSIPENINNIRHQFALLEQKYERVRHSVSLLAVSKTHSSDKILEALEAGQKDFGENYLQEALEKITSLCEYSLTWHFIGPIQSNKTKSIAENFTWVHSVDRLKIAQRLSQQRPSNLPHLNILLQVNISEEESKSGLSLAELPDVAESIAKLPRLNLCGLMAIPAPSDDFLQQRESFKQLAKARDSLLAMGLSSCQHLSMGMSRDYEAAIAEGASIVRIGTDIFGARK